MDARQLPDETPTSQLIVAQGKALTPTLEIARKACVDDADRFADGLRTKQQGQPALRPRTGASTKVGGNRAIESRRKTPVSILASPATVGNIRACYSDEGRNQSRAGGLSHEANTRPVAGTQLMRALLVAQEGIHRGALAAARALKRAGWVVGCTSDDRRSLAAASRATAHWHYTPSPADDLDAFLDAVQAAVDEGGYEVLLPGGDAETLALSIGRDRIKACVPYPSHANVLRAFDKLDLVVGAARAGLATPRTMIASDAELDGITGPVVVKSRLHWAPGSPQAGLRLPTKVVFDRDEAAQRVAEVRESGGEPLLQEIIRGRIMHCHVAMDRDGNMITCVKQLSEPLQLPPEGGTRVRSETVPTEESLAQGVSKFLRDLGWYGFASIQFMQPDVGPPRVVDFNGRLSLSFEQTIAAGTNFPALWACVATGRDYGEVSPTRMGVRFQWFEGDIQRALIQRRGGLLRDVADTLLYARGAVHGVWRISDPIPSLRYWQYYLGRVPRIVRQLRGSEFRGDDGHPTAGLERRTNERV
jgi:predicted ATP-grasp superfamily ATP-dependent carboligase